MSLPDTRMEETPKKIAFVHIPRTAGTYTLIALSKLLSSKGFKIKNSWKDLNRDWNKEELLSFLDEPGKIFVHNHVGNWDKETINKYKDEGWFIFTFIRHPGDRLCSEYYFFNFEKKWGKTLDEYISHQIKLSRKSNTIPSYWKTLDFMDIFSENKFLSFMKNKLKLDNRLIGERIRNKLNESNNKGYDFYCKNLMISKNSQKLLKRSDQYKIYLNIKYIKKQKFLFNYLKDYLSPIEKIEIKNEKIIKYLLLENKPITKLMRPSQISTILNHLSYTIENNIEGDIVELGCNEGTTSLFISRILKYYNSNKKFHVYDSFEGLPEKTKRDKNNHPLNKRFKKGAVIVSKNQLIKNYKKQKLKLPKIHKGWFKEIPDTEYPNKISFALFDGDYYESIIDSFDKVYHKMSKGGIIIIDDYDFEALPGVKKACRGFLKDKAEKDNIIEIEDLGIIYRK